MHLEELVNATMVGGRVSVMESCDRPILDEPSALWKGAIIRLWTSHQCDGQPATQQRSKAFVTSSSPRRIWTISRKSNGAEDHESVAIDPYHHTRCNVVKPKGIWLLHNNIMGASPDGLVFTDPHAACAVAILEVPRHDARCGDRLRLGVAT